MSDDTGLSQEGELQLAIWRAAAIKAGLHLSTVQDEDELRRELTARYAAEINAVLDDDTIAVAVLREHTARYAAQIRAALGGTPIEVHAADAADAADEADRPNTAPQEGA
jgi:hypothetical protein